MARPVVHQDLVRCASVGDDDIRVAISIHVGHYDVLGAGGDAGKGRRYELPGPVVLEKQVLTRRSHNDVERTILIEIAGGGADMTRDRITLIAIEADRIRTCLI